jgi:tRNA-dihydrouridine synthase 4
VDFIRTIQDAGVDFITIHGRTRHQRSREPVNIEAIKVLVPHCTVPVLANGDVVSLSSARSIASATGANGVLAARSLLSNLAMFAGHEKCPWEAVEKFMNYVIRAPIPHKLVLHHLSEMCSSDVRNAEGEIVRKSLLSKKKRIEMMECGDMLELIDWLDGVREIKRL